MAPISVLRAGSQSRNPHADADDIGLLVALHEGRCVGYHGVLPGKLRIGQHLSKVSWLVTFYLDTAYRGRGYGTRLVSEILQTGLDLVTTGITLGADGVYRRAGFRQLGELTYYQVLTPNSEPYALALQKLKTLSTTFVTRPVKRLDPTTGPAAFGHDSEASFLRNHETLNWMIQNPWIESRSVAQEDVGHYYFSRVRDLYRCMALEIWAPHGKTPKGFVVLSVSRHKRKSVLKVLDICFKDPGDIGIAGYVALEYAREFKSDRLEYPQALAVFFQSQPDLAPLVKKKKRSYLYLPRGRKSSLAKLAGDITLNYADSDTAFT